MEEDLIFQMGKFRAKIPKNLHYTKDHLWILLGNPSTVGITSYKQRFFMDVEDISFSVEVGDNIEPGEQIAQIEGVKAVAEVVAAFKGKVKQINEELDLDPTLINASTYEYGWLLKMEGLQGDLMSSKEYLEFVQRDWEKAVEDIMKDRGGGKILPA